MFFMFVNCDKLIPFFNLLVVVVVVVVFFFFFWEERDMKWV